MAEADLIDLVAAQHQAPTGPAPPRAAWPGPIGDAGPPAG
jgi:hypothetical protein